MADIREQIKRKYGVDIETLNLFFLYKISGPASVSIDTLCASIV